MSTIISTEDQFPLTGRQGRAQNLASFVPGIFKDYENEYETEPTVGTPNGVTVKSGCINLGSCLVEDTGVTNLVFQIDGVYEVIAQVDLDENTAEITFTSDPPVQNNLIQNITGIYEYSLATVTVSGGAVTEVIDNRYFIVAAYPVSYRVPAGQSIEFTFRTHPTRQDLRMSLDCSLSTANGGNGAVAEDVFQCIFDDFINDGDTTISRISDTLELGSSAGRPGEQVQMLGTGFVMSRSKGRRPYLDLQVQDRNTETRFKGQYGDGKPSAGASTYQIVAGEINCSPKKGTPGQSVQTFSFNNQLGNEFDVTIFQAQQIIDINIV